MELSDHTVPSTPARVLRRALGLAAPFMRTEIPVLTYHSIDESGSLLSVAAGALRTQLAALHAAGWRTLTIHEYAEHIRRGRRPPRTLLITFDDGYRNFAERAVPILSDFGFTATVFVAIDWIGKCPLWLTRDIAMTEKLLDEVRMTAAERVTIKRSMQTLLRDTLMDWCDLRRLVAAGFDVQSHSAGHHFLTALSPDELAADLRRSRLALAEQLGCAAPAIAYPYGASNAKVAQAARDAGYEVGFVADHNPRDADHMMIWRSGVSGQLTPRELLSVMRSWPLYPRLRTWRRRHA